MQHKAQPGPCQKCLWSSTAGPAVPGEHKFQPVLPYTMKAEGEKCNTSLSQAIPVPNSSLSIIWWFIINRLPLQFWSRNFLWINVGFVFSPPFLLQSRCLKPSHVTVSAPASLGCLTSGGLFWGYSWKTLRLSSFAFSRAACAGNVPFRNDQHQFLCSAPDSLFTTYAKGFFFFSLSVNTVDHFISSVYCFLIWMKWGSLAAVIQIRA